MPKKKRGNGWKHKKTRKSSSHTAVRASKQTIDKRHYEKVKQPKAQKQQKKIATNKRIVLKLSLKRRLAIKPDATQIQTQSQNKINTLQSVIHEQNEQIHRLHKQNTKFQNHINRKNRTINSLSMDLSHVIMTETLVSDTDMASNDEFVIV
eukprot:356601_1